MFTGRADTRADSLPQGEGLLDGRRGDELW